MTHTQKPWVAQLAVHCPLNKTYLHDDLWADPMSANAGQTDGGGERGLRNLDLIELRSEVEQQCGIKAGANLACEYKILVSVIADEQRAKTDPLSLRIGESTDNKL